MGSGGRGVLGWGGEGGEMGWVFSHTCTYPCIKPKQHPPLHTCFSYQPHTSHTHTLYTLTHTLTQIGPGTIEDVFCQTFVVEVPAYGTTHTIPLKPGGEDIAVTEDNRQEFVDLYVKFWLHTSIENQFEVR